MDQRKALAAMVDKDDADLSRFARSYGLRNLAWICEGFGLDEKHSIGDFSDGNHWAHLLFRDHLDGVSL